MLYLGNNQLTTLPAQIMQLTGLTELDLGDNQLTTLPAEIVQLTGLKKLDLSGNKPLWSSILILRALHENGTEIVGQDVLDLGAGLGNLRNSKLTKFPTLPANIGQL